MVTLAFYGFSFLLMLSAMAVIFSRNTVHSVLFLIFAFFNAAGLFILVNAEFLAMILVIVYVGAVAVLFLFVVMMLNITPQYSPSLFDRKKFNRAITISGQFISYLFILGGIFYTLISIPFIVEIIQHQHWHILSQLSLLDLGRESFAALFAPKFPWIVSVTILLIALLVAYQGAKTLTRASLLQLLGQMADSLIFLLFLGGLLVAFFLALGFTWMASAFHNETISTPIPPSDLMTNTQAIGQVLYTDFLYAFQLTGIILLVAMIGAIALTLRQREQTKRQNLQSQLMRDPAHTLRLTKVPLRKGI